MRAASVPGSTPGETIRNRDRAASNITHTEGQSGGNPGLGEKEKPLFRIGRQKCR